MLLSLSTACVYHLPLERACALAAESGFDGIELVSGPETWLRRPSAIEATVQRWGLTIYSVHQSLLSFTPRGRGSWRMIEAVELALALGCPRVVIHDHGALRWADPSARTWLWILNRCREMLAGSQTRLALENPGVYSAAGRRNPLASPSVLADFARRHDLDITLDTCHVGTAGTALQETYEALRHRVTNVHLSDLKPVSAPTAARAYKTLFRHHQLPGEGILPLAPLLARMRADGFGGPITLEPSPAALQAWSCRRLKARLAQAAAFVRAAEQVPAFPIPASVPATGR